MAKIIVGIMGPGKDATRKDCDLANELGRLAALKGWVVLTGGRKHGVMHAALKGAKAAGGLTIGILPTAVCTDMSSAVDIPVLTGLGEGRNVVNALTSRVVLVCGMSSGTASEVALALRTNRPVVLVRAKPSTVAFLASLQRPFIEAHNAAEAISLVDKLLKKG